jgi:hypothetical protein
MLTPVQSFTYHTRAICSHESHLADYTCKAPCKASIYMDVMMYCAVQQIIQWAKTITKHESQY